LNALHKQHDGPPAQVPWERFFDAKALRSTNITVLERFPGMPAASAAENGRIKFG
jgi:hypothetical protein